MVRRVIGAVVLGLAVGAAAGQDRKLEVAQPVFEGYTPEQRAALKQADRFNATGGSVRFLYPAGGKPADVVEVWLHGAATDAEGKLVALFPTITVADVQLDRDNRKLGEPTFAALGKLKGLQAVRVHDGPGVTDNALKHLAGHKSLGVLWLGGTAVTDKGLTHLAAVKSLRQLHLRDCPGVTDASVKTLSQMKQLESLRLDRTRMTRNGVAALKKNLPKATVTAEYLD
jgi:hypothetical protein